MAYVSGNRSRAIGSKFFGRGDERVGTMGHEKVTIAESPKHADAGYMAVEGRHHVHVAVADVDSCGPVGPELRECLVHCVGSRLLADTLALADGHLKSGPKK